VQSHRFSVGLKADSQEGAVMKPIKWAIVSGALFAAFTSLPALAGNPCCAEQEFQGVGVSTDDVAIQLVELKRVSANEVQATWTLRNKSKQPRRLTKGSGGWAEGYLLAYDAALQDLVARVLFPVAKDTGVTPLAGKHPTVPYKGIWLKPGKTMTTLAKFLVPASTTSVNVTLPGAATPWNNVTITQ
jgi:hypothetical protein